MIGDMKYMICIGLDLDPNLHYDVTTGQWSLPGKQWANKNFVEASSPVLQSQVDCCGDVMAQ